MPLTYNLAAVSEIDPTTLYRILWLRVRVFIVEQSAAYEELDGRDLEPDALLLWAEEEGEILGTLRILTETDAEAMRIGRVATADAARGRGIGVEMMERAVVHCGEVQPRHPILLDAQMHLTDWYGRFGFAVSGDAFVEDDIPHVPMRREPA